jgi:hypothetical protein
MVADRLFLPYVRAVSSEFGSATQIAQRLLWLEYRRLISHGEDLPPFEEVGFRAYSQNEEDGLLLLIFSAVGTTNKICVEIAAGDGRECNTANLILNHGWTGLLVDGDPRNVASGRAFFGVARDTWAFPPKFVHAWIDAENVNDVVSGHGFVGEIDLLSVDIDGNDYWVWKALDCVRPRVVVIEYHNIWGPDRAVTIPYRSDFKRSPVCRDYAGASLGAMVRLGRAKGYRLVGSNRYCFNAFFVRDDVGHALLPEVQPDWCLRHPLAQTARQARLPAVSACEWVEV